MLEFLGVEVSKKTLDWLQSKHVEVKLEQTINLEDVADGSKPYKTSAGETIKADYVFLYLGKSLAPMLEFLGVEVSKKTLDWLQSKHVEVKLEQTINLEDVADGSKPYKTSAGETIKADYVFLYLGKSLAPSWLKKNILRDSLDANWNNDC
nr:FAD/NAD(P)-binding oxidoreductase family protein [Tanacetum cinerariifolium]